MMTAKPNIEEVSFLCCLAKCQQAKADLSADTVFHELWGPVATDTNTATDFCFNIQMKIIPIRLKAILDAS